MSIACLIALDSLRDSTDMRPHPQTGSQYGRSATLHRMRAVKLSYKLVGHRNVVTEIVYCVSIAK
jgi:hypothetical protein